MLSVNIGFNICKDQLKGTQDLNIVPQQQERDHTSWYSAQKLAETEPGNVTREHLAPPIFS